MYWKCLSDSLTRYISNYKTVYSNHLKVKTLFKQTSQQYTKLCLSHFKVKIGHKAKKSNYHNGLEKSILSGMNRIFKINMYIIKKYTQLCREKESQNTKLKLTTLAKLVKS